MRFGSTVLCAAAMALAASVVAGEGQRTPRGGIVEDPKSGKGALVIVNAQNRLPADDLRQVCKEITDALNRRLRLEPATADFDPAEARKAFGADVALTVVDRPGRPVSLIALEDRWAAVNLAALPSDGDFAALAKREVLRTFAVVSGGYIAQFPDTLMSARDLKGVAAAELYVTADVTRRQDVFLDSIGVTAVVSGSYTRACREGWAPVPTNDVQRAIWDEVHAIPKKPIKIEFDPKKGR